MRLALLLVLVSGCVSTHPAPLGTDAGRADLNARTAGRQARLYVRGAPSRLVRNLHIGPDETTWTDLLSGRPASAPTADVATVTMRRGSPWRSVLIGAGVGAATGLLVAVADDCRSIICFPPTVYIGAGAAYGVLIGGGVGVSQRDRFVNGQSPAELIQVRLDSLAHL